MNEHKLDIVTYINNKIDHGKSLIKNKNLYYIKILSYKLYALEQCREIVCTCEGDPSEALYFFLCELQHSADITNSTDVSMCMMEKVRAVTELINDINKLYPFF